MDNLVTILDLIGAVAFAISGAMVALQIEFDLLGVIILACCTATGGGMIRDITLGHIPPRAFQDPTDVFLAFLTALVVFSIAWYFNRKNESFRQSRIYRRVLFWADTLGLGIFAVIGVRHAFNAYGSDLGFLCVFCGALTGCGGGLLRDIFANRKPYIFTEDIYATAAAAGALVCFEFMKHGHGAIGIWVGVCLVIIIRYFADRYHWGLPVIRDFRSE